MCAQRRYLARGLYAMREIKERLSYGRLREQVAHAIAAHIRIEREVGPMAEENHAPVIRDQRLPKCHRREGNQIEEGLGTLKVGAAPTLAQWRRIGYVPPMGDAKGRRRQRGEALLVVIQTSHA